MRIKQQQQQQHSYYSTTATATATAASQRNNSNHNSSSSIFLLRAGGGGGGGHGCFLRRTTTAGALLLLLGCYDFFLGTQENQFLLNLYGSGGGGGNGSTNKVISSSIEEKQTRAFSMTAVPGPPAYSSNNRTDGAAAAAVVVLSDDDDDSKNAASLLSITSHPNENTSQIKLLAPTSIPTTATTTTTNNDTSNSTTTTTTTTTITHSKNNSSATTTRIRWNSKELQDWVAKTNLVKNWTQNTTMTHHVNVRSIMREVMDFAPKPKGKDVELYNRDAWHRLRALLLLPGLEPQQQQQHQGQRRAMMNQSSTINNNNNNNNTVLLCSIGGSSTAGGGAIYPGDRFDRVFAAMIQSTADANNEEELLVPDGGETQMMIPTPHGTGSTHNSRSTTATATATTTLDLSIVNRGHGSRGSAHSGFFIHSLIPADTDIILWEFAINDEHTRVCKDINSALVIWLEQVARHSSPPPLVILAYLWDVSFYHNNESISGRVFRCHERIAAKYDFVVGSVNMASYLNNLQWGYRSVKKSFVADMHHPNEMGHLLLSYLLWDLVTDDKRLPITSSTSSSNKSKSKSSTTTKWAWCSKDPSPTNEELVRLASKKKLPFASWIADTPRNDDYDNSGMLSPPRIVARPSNKNINATTNSSEILTKLHGSAANYRVDRHLSIVLPCCGTGEHLAFDLSATTTTTTTSTWSDQNSGMPNNNNTNNMTGKRLSAFQMLFPKAQSQPDQLRQNLVIEILDSNGGEIMIDSLTSSSSSAEESFLVFATNTTGTGTACWQGLEKGPWFFFPNKTWVSRISFCSRCTTTADNSSSLLLSLEYLALF